MADYVDPGNFAIGDLLRAADLNQMLDNLRYFYDIPAAAVRLDSPQSVQSQSDTTIVWSSNRWGSEPAMWDDTSPSNVLIVRPGVYEIVCAALWDDTQDVTKRALFMHVNGVRRRGIQYLATAPTEQVLTSVTNLGDGDSVSFQVRQLSGGPLDLQPTRTIATVRWVAAPQPASF